MPVERTVGGTSLIDVLDRVLDKGIVIDAWVRVSLVGIDLITVEARIVVASIDTYLKYSEAVGQVAPGVQAGRAGAARTPEARAGGERRAAAAARGERVRGRSPGAAAVRRRRTAAARPAARDGAWRGPRRCARRQRRRARAPPER